MRFHILIAPAEAGGFSARCVEVLGVNAQGATREEALEKARQQIRAILQVRRREAELTVQRAADQQRLEAVDLEL